MKDWITEMLDNPSALVVSWRTWLLAVTVLTFIGLGEVLIYKDSKAEAQELLVTFDGNCEFVSWDDPKGLTAVSATLECGGEHVNVSAVPVIFALINNKNAAIACTRRGTGPYDCAPEEEAAQQPKDEKGK